MKLVFIFFWTLYFIDKISSAFSKNQLKRSSPRCRECTNSDPRVQAQLDLMKGGHRKRSGNDVSDDKDTTGGNNTTLTRYSRVKCRDDVRGTGEMAVKGSKVRVHYVGRLEKTGKIFDSSKRPFRFKIGSGEVIKGWDEGIVGMKVGGRRTIKIPPQLAYGSRGSPPKIPPNATLIFDIALLEVRF